MHNRAYSTCVPALGNVAKHCWSTDGSGSTGISGDNTSQVTKPEMGWFLWGKWEEPNWSWHDTFFVFHLCFPTDPFTTQELQNPWHDIIFKDFEVLKLWKGRLGSGAQNYKAIISHKEGQGLWGRQCNSWTGLGIKVVRCHVLTNLDTKDW